MVLLNLDAGEYDDEPEELWGLADVLLIACGGHAGDERTMERVVRFCAARERPRIGAHPSYPDRDGFGRRSIDIDPESLRATVAEQCSKLAAIAAAHGRRVEYVKPHGALYHDAYASFGLAGHFIWGVNDALGREITVIGPRGGYLEQMAHTFGPPGDSVRYFVEGFADRATRPDGSLVPRTEPGALIDDPQRAAARARELVATVNTICVHADTPNALAIARAVRAAIDAGT